MSHSMRPCTRLRDRDAPADQNVDMSTPGSSVVDRLAAGREACVQAIRIEEARVGERASWPDWTPQAVREAYAGIGVSEPWRHQVSAAQSAHSGQHTVLATGTASGKSLAFTLPVLAALESNRRATALYISPTKALAADQLRSLESLGLPWLRPATYDGDTPTDERTWARAHANYLLTNPDMLHHSMLPGHARWASFFRHLEFIVVDECHTYRGVLGAHMSAVIRRLRRVAAHYKSHPVVICASATIGEPEVVASRLIGAPAVAFAEDTSASPGRTIVLWQPPETEDGRRSAVAEAALLLPELVLADRQTLIFVRSRRGAEFVASTAHNQLAQLAPAAAARIASYRGGYLPEERRDLEARLRSRDVLGIASTSALELGIDISGLDAVITAGWPGTRASIWQQFGRCGRDEEPGLAIFIAREDALDTYLVHNPDALFDAPVETTVFDPANPYVLSAHLCAAAAEVPLTSADIEDWFGLPALKIVDDLTETGMLRKRPNGWYWTKRERASDLADLRSTGGAPILITERGTGRLLGTVDAASAHQMVHPGAVYVHQGRTYLVHQLYLDNDVAIVSEEELEYTTFARDISDIRVIDVLESRMHGDIRVCTGMVEVTSRTVSFQRRHINGTNLGEVGLTLPERALLTRAVWWQVPEAEFAALNIDADAIPGTVHAMEHAAIGMLPLFATCDRWDIGGVSTRMHPDTGMPTIFIYDGFPGGAGFAEHGYHHTQQWLEATRDVVASCRCATGCPSCIQSPKCGNGNDPLDKAGSIALLNVLSAQPAQRN